MCGISHTRNTPPYLVHFVTSLFWRHRYISNFAISEVPHYFFFRRSIIFSLVSFLWTLFDFSHSEEAWGYIVSRTLYRSPKKWVTFTIISGPSEYAMYCTYSFLCFRKKGAAFSREIECKRGSKWECESVCVCARGKKSYYRKSTINNAISQWAANHYYFGFLYPIIVCYEP